MTPTEATYRSLLGKLMQRDSSPLVNAYAAVDELLAEVTLYVKVWLQYQSLWDMEPSNIYGKLEFDLSRWQKLLMDVKYVDIKLGIVITMHGECQIFK